MVRIRVRYRRIRVYVNTKKPSKCECCGRPGRLELHHWKYQHTTAEVRFHPQLALDNTTWLCFTCHKLADALRKILDAPRELVQILLKLRGIEAPNQEPNFLLPGRLDGPVS